MPASLIRKGVLPVAILLAAGACAAVFYLSLRGGSDSYNRVIVGTAPPNPAAAQPSLQRLAPLVYDSNGALTVQVGDMVDSNGVEMGVTNVMAPFTASDAAMKATRGQFMVVEVEVHNSGAPGDRPVNVSSGGSFELQDEIGQIYQAVSAPAAKNAPNGAVAPGGTLNGSLTYDVPTGRTYLLHFKNEAMSNGQVIVNLGQH